MGERRGAAAAEAATPEPGTPEEPVPPGQALQEVLELIDMSQTELAERTGRPKKTINEIINGRASITAETALQLERALGVEAAQWSGLESAWQGHLARQAEEEVLAAELGWLDELPVAEMTGAKWCRRGETPIEQMRILLSFFGVASPEQWRQVYRAPQANFRAAPGVKSDPGALAAWLRAGELQAQGIKCRPWSRKSFQVALLDARRKTVEGFTVVQDRLRERCARAGVALATARQVRGLRVHGASRWLSPRKALIQLNLLGGNEAELWWTFFEQAAHLLFHGKKLVFVEGGGEDDGDVEGQRAQREVAEAVAWAEEFLVPEESLEMVRKVLDRDRETPAVLMVLAGQIGVSVGLLIHRLEKLGWLPKGAFEGMKNPLSWVPPE